MSLWTTRLLLLFLLTVGVSVLVYSDEIIRISDDFPVCVFYSHTGKLCPACGNTRSVRALLNFDILCSVGYNPMPFILTLSALMLCTELTAKCLGRQIRIFPRSNLFPVISAIILGIYYLLRNYLSFLTLC